MGETDTHVRYIMDVRTALEHYYGARQDVYVSGNNLLYYVEGDPRKCVSPGVYVVFGIPRAERRIYRLWEEGKAPDFVLEITSRKTRRDDTGHKRDLYQALGVREYVLYDPLGEWLHPALQGYTLDGDVFAPIQPDASGALRSRVLGLTFGLTEGRLRRYETESGRPLLYRAEEAEALQAAQTEIARLREQLAQLRRG